MPQREKSETGGILRKESKEIVPVDEPITSEERQLTVSRLDNQRMTELEMRIREKELELKMRIREKEIDAINETTRELRNWANENNRESASQTIRRPDGQEIKVEVKLGEKKPFLDRLFPKKQR